MVAAAPVPTRTRVPGSGVGAGRLVESRRHPFCPQRGAMESLSPRLKQALDETRMLMLGVQVLIGFQHQVVLQPSFERLSQGEKWVMVANLGLLLCTLTCLIGPAMHHHIVEGGNITSGALRAATVYATIALLPFAAALGLSFSAAAMQIWSRPIAMLVGVVAYGTAAGLWYGLELVRRAHRRSRSTRPPGGEDMATPSSVKDRIDHVLTEARMVLPGAQALSGFQFAAIFMDGFAKLPTSSQYVHFTSLGCIALTTILLLTPAAYHRIVEEGEDTEHFHRFASRIVLAATVPLALGMAGDVFVVVRKVSDHVAWSAAAAASAVALCYGLWFGVTLISRRAKTRSRQALRAA
jgi:hypothetical protein